MERRFRLRMGSTDAACPESAPVDDSLDEGSGSESNDARSGDMMG